MVLNSCELNFYKLVSIGLFKFFNCILHFRSSLANHKIYIFLYFYIYLNIILK